MENASKALLIAGAILISILLIALGVMVYSAGQGVTENAGTQLSGTQITTYNSTFTNYEGKKTGTEVRSLINAILTNNNNENAANPNITINGAAATSVSKLDYKAQQYYNVTCDFNGTDGLISNVKIESATSSGE